MKKILLLVWVLLITFATQGEEVAYYQAKISGVVCSSCKQHVQTSLMSQLPGTLTVEVKKGEVEGSQLLLITSTDHSVDEQKIVKALGSYAKNYQVSELKKS
jgi:copper chaperone CopZ